MTPRYNEFEPDERYRRDLAEVARRESWKASRAPFTRQDFAFQLALTSSAPVTSYRLDATADNDLTRFKRIQMKFVVPKGPAKGWFGLTRQAEGTTLDLSSYEFSTPGLLRPIQFLANPDHATYWDCYLPAINLADNGSLYAIARVYPGSGTTALNVVGRAVAERPLHV